MCEVASKISFSTFKFPLVNNRHLNLDWGVKILHRMVLLDLAVESVPWFEPNPCRGVWTHSQSQTADLSLFKPRLGVLNGVDMEHVLHTWQIPEDDWWMISYKAGREINGHDEAADRNTESQLIKRVIKIRFLNLSEAIEMRKSEKYRLIGVTWLHVFPLLSGNLLDLNNLLGIPLDVRDVSHSNSTSGYNTRAHCTG